MNNIVIVLAVAAVSIYGFMSSLPSDMIVPPAVTYGGSIYSSQCLTLNITSLPILDGPFFQYINDSIFDSFPNYYSLNDLPPKIAVGAGELWVPDTIINAEFLSEITALVSKEYVGAYVVLYERPDELHTTPGSNYTQVRVTEDTSYYTGSDNYMYVNMTGIDLPVVVLLNSNASIVPYEWDTHPEECKHTEGYGFTFPSDFRTS